MGVLLGERDGSGVVVAIAELGQAGGLVERAAGVADDGWGSCGRSTPED